MTFTPPKRHRKYFHATNTPIQKLRKGEELYIGDGEMPIGGRLTYVVYLPTSAKIFSGIDVFKNLHAADKRGNIYWEISQEYSPPHRAVQVEEFSKDLGIDPDDREALEAYLESWFLDRNNYTEEGLSIIDELDLFNRLGPYEMSEYFANEQADPSFLNKALEKRGYDGRYELEETSPWLIENVPQSVCVFDQSILTIDPTPITGRRKRNPYSQTDSEGYLINPNDGGVFWWHHTDAEFIDFSKGSESVSVSFFSGTYELELMDIDESDPRDYVLTVKIKIDKGCGVFDSRDLFVNTPQNLIDTVKSVLDDRSEYWERKRVNFDYIDQAHITDAQKKALTEGDFNNPLISKLQDVFWRDEIDDLDSLCLYILGLYTMDYYRVREVAEEKSLMATLPHKCIVGWLERENLFLQTLNLAIQTGVGGTHIEVVARSENDTSDNWRD